MYIEVFIKHNLEGVATIFNTPDIEQARAQSSYNESKMEGAIHIPHQLQKQSLDVQPKDDQEEGTTYQYPSAL